jgi:hypothetical protein
MTVRNHRKHARPATGPRRTGEPARLPTSLGHQRSKQEQRPSSSGFLQRPHRRTATSFRLRGVGMQRSSRREKNTSHGWCAKPPKSCGRCTKYIRHSGEPTTEQRHHPARPVGSTHRPGALRDEGNRMSSPQKIPGQESNDVSSNAFGSLTLAAASSWLLQYGGLFSAWWWAGLLLGVVATVFVLVAAGEIRARRGWTPWLLLPTLAFFATAAGLIRSMQ